MFYAFFEIDNESEAVVAGDVFIILLINYI